MSNTGTEASCPADEKIDLGAAEQDPLGAPIDEPSHDLPVPVTRAVLDDADTELVVDDVVHGKPILRVRHQHVELVAPAQAADVEVLLHRVGGRQQPDRRELLGADRLGRRVGDVHERHLDGLGDRVGHVVHRVGAGNEQLGTGVPEYARLAGQSRAGLLPPPSALQRLDVAEVDRPEHQVSGVAAPTAQADLLVGEAVVLS